MPEDMRLKRGIPVIISGPSGSGKGTVVSEILRRSTDYQLSVSATTRSPRPGEIAGTHYYFISEEEFRTRIAGGRMLEFASYVGNFYGTPRDEVEQRLENGIHVILEIEVQGALQVKRNLPEAVLIFMLPPDAQTLENRLRNRGTNTEEDIRKRMDQARRELECMAQYDYVVINGEGTVCDTAERVMQIVNSEQCAVRRNPELAANYFSEQ